jgi:hypothetical protein
LCKTYQVTPDDPFITEMDPVLKIWYYENWLADQNDEADLAKNHAYLLGSFWNPEAVKQLVGDSNVHESSEEEFEESSQMVRNMNLKMLEEEQKKKAPVRRRRRQIKG